MVSNALILLNFFQSMVCNLKRHRGLLDSHGNITEDGRLAAKVPIYPAWYHAIKKASENQCAMEMVSLAALASTQQSIFLRPIEVKYVADLSRHQFADPFSDHITSLNAFHAYIGAKGEKKVNMASVSFPFQLLY
jgi:pre-mRNA-splicing factor ATP-dependent RNA helicase DHX15/PRP43